MNSVNVYVKEIIKPYRFVKQEHGNFKSHLLGDEKKKVINFTVKGGSTLFNGDTVRLDRVVEHDDFIELHISPLTYFDSLVTNMLYHKYSEKLHELGNTQEELKIKSNIAEIYKSGVVGFDTIINNDNLANTVAISCLIVDSVGKYGLVSRNQKVAVGKGLMGVTVTGVVDGTDYLEIDPILSCAKREAKEELGITICAAKVRAIAISSKKLQPIFIVDAFMRGTWESVLSKLTNTVDFSNENEKFYIVTGEELALIAKKYPMTDAAKYHIVSLCGGDV